MYNPTQYNGKELTKKTLCLTYDDGPGKDTYAIAEFLHSLNIRATFFVVGKYAYHHQEILKALKKFGHIIGNHTYDHPDLPYYVSINGNVQDQVFRTDLLIKEYSDDGVIYFRPPYGKWSDEVANDLNLNALISVNYIGPIYWEIAGIDCYCWQQGLSVDDAIDKYMVDLRKKKERGILVMHDEIADMDYLKPQNLTLELTKKLIPHLLKQGYTFVGLDEIESIKKAAEATSRFNIMTSKNKLLSLIDSGSDIIAVDKNSERSIFTMYKSANSKVAIMAANGLYLNTKMKGTLLAVSTHIEDYELFDWIPVDHNCFILRSASGHYLTSTNKNGDNILANAQHMRHAELFKFKSLDIPAKKNISFKARWLLLKRRFMFIKSKLANPLHFD